MKLIKEDGSYKTTNQLGWNDQEVMQVVFENGKLYNSSKFEEVRERANSAL